MCKHKIGFIILSDPHIPSADQKDVADKWQSTQIDSDSPQRFML